MSSQANRSEQTEAFSRPTGKKKKEEGKKEKKKKRLKIPSSTAV